MFAVINYKGKQYFAEDSKVIYLDRVNQEIGSDLKLDKAMLMISNGKIMSNKDSDKFSVTATVVSHFLDKKLTVFKFRRRHRSMKKTGHRQKKTAILVKINQDNN